MAMGRAARGARVCVVGACVLPGAAADTYYRCGLVVGAAPSVLCLDCRYYYCCVCLAASSCAVKLPAPFAVRCLSKGSQPKPFSKPYVLAGSHLKVV
jgi:hypothetical protein